MGHIEKVDGHCVCVMKPYRLHSDLNELVVWVGNCLYLGMALWWFILLNLDSVDATLLSWLVYLSSHDLFEVQGINRAFITVSFFESTFRINFYWVEKPWFQQPNNITTLLLFFVLFVTQCLFLVVFNCSGQKFLGRIVTKHSGSTWISCCCWLRKNQEPFVHSVEQLDILNVVSFHPRVQRKYVL